MVKTITGAISFVVGMVMILEYYFKLPALSSVAKAWQNWAVIISAFALGAGCINLFGIHVRNVAQRKTRYQASAILLACMVITLIIGLGQGIDSPSYNFIFKQLYSPLVQSSAGLLIFYIVTAALRAFRLRNIDAWCLLISTTLVMLGNAPFGRLIYGRFPDVANWILTVPNMAGQRAVVIGGSLGIIATALRTILGLEATRGGSAGVGPS
jgi:predicted membrane protein